MSDTLDIATSFHVPTPALASSGTAGTARRRFSGKGRRSMIARASAYGALVIVGIFYVAPLVWLVLSAFEPGAQIGASTPFHLSFSNFTQILNWNTTFEPMINSAIQAGFTALLTVVIALFAAYPLSRYNLRFRKPFLYSIIFATGLPITAILVPVYSMFARFNLVDNVPAVIFFMTSTALPFGIWLMKGFMDGVPVELEQAAWVDGASWLQSLLTIVAPLMLPGIAVIAIMTFVLQWGNFFVPFILLSSTGKLPASVSIYNFFSQYGSVAYGQLAAFSLIYTLPAIGLWLVMSRFLRGSFTLAGAVKG